MKPKHPCAALLALLVAACSPAVAVADYEAAVSSSSGSAFTTCHQTFQQQTGPFAAALSEFGPFDAGRGSASAAVVSSGSELFLQVSASATSNPHAPGTLTKAGGCGDAKFTIEGIVIDGPPGTVSISTQVHLIGTNDVADTPNRGTYFQNGDMAVWLGTIVLAAVVSGEYDQTFVTSSKNVTVGVPFDMEVTIDNGLDVRAYELAGDPGSATWDVTTTYRLLIPDPNAVLNLPSGYTANSSDGILVNNALTSQNVSVPRPQAAARLHAARPNPFGPSTSIRFELPQAGPVALTVYDVTGRVVRRLAKGWHGAGAHEIAWRGRNEDGVRMAPGVYLYELQAGGFRETRRVALLK